MCTSATCPTSTTRAGLDGFYALITDQSARHLAEQALREADRRKDEFLAMLAHELRNPLAPIRSAAEVLRMGDPQGGPQQWAREVIERQTQHLTRLVDDLLDVSRITRGMITIRREPLDLGVIVQRSVETSRPMIDARQQQLTVVLPERPLRVEGDMTRLVQVIANLLNNAAKYTEEGGHIAVEVRDESGMATVAVRDNGIGLSAELLPHVFDLFTQANQAARSVAGRPRDRPDAGAQAGRAARRHRRSEERRPRSGQRVHRALATARRRGLERLTLAAPTPASRPL